MRTFTFTNRILGLLRYLIVALVVITVLLGLKQAPRGFPVETNLQALFPQAVDNAISQRINDQLTTAFGNQMLIALETVNQDQADAAIALVESEVMHSDFLKLREQSDFSEALNSLIRETAPFRFNLLTKQQQSDLRQGNTDTIVQHAKNALLGFNPNPAVLTLAKDPLDLFSSYVNSLHPQVAGEVHGNALMFNKNNRIVLLLPIELKGDSFSLDMQEKLNLWLSSLKSKLQQDALTSPTKLMTSGVAFHAARASKQAKAEINWLGAFDIAGTLLVFILTFFSLRPLLLTLASIAFGSVTSIVLNLAIFGKLHLITLVFGTSLIGVAIDYSVHHLCKHQALFDATQAQSSSQKIISKLLPALIMGLLTSLIGYTCLFQAPLPGLKQIASFSVIGLASAWLFVVVAFPLLMRKTLRPPHALIDYLAFFSWRFWTCLPKWLMVLVGSVLVAICVFGLSYFHTSNDIRLLYKPDQDLIESERFLQDLTQSVSPNQYFVISAATEEALLQKEENFRAAVLDPLVTQGKLLAYVATSQWVPSLKQQRENFNLVAEHLYQSKGPVNQLLTDAGFDQQLFDQARQSLLDSKQLFLTPSLWQDHARADQKILWLGNIDGQYRSLIALRGIKDISRLTTVDAAEGVQWVNRVAELSSMLKQLGATAFKLLGLAYIGIALLTLFFYRTPKALCLLLVPLGTSLIVISLLSLCGVPISLFHIFALYLIMGMGMDYAIFSYNEGLKDAISQRSIFLSALTSAMSFGVLSFSSTPMIQSFGMVMLTGSMLNLFLAPLVGYLTPPKAQGSH